MCLLIETMNRKGLRAVFTVLRGILRQKFAIIIVTVVIVATLSCYAYVHRGDGQRYKLILAPFLQERWSALDSSPSSRQKVNHTDDVALLSMEASFLAVAQALKSEILARRLHWNKVEDAADSPVPTQFQSAGFYDSTLRKFKFYFTGYPENKPLYCRLYTIVAEKNLVVPEVRSVERHVTDSDSILGRDIAAGVAVCDKPLSSANNLFESPFKRPVLGVLTYSNIEPNQNAIKAQLKHYLKHKGISLLTQPSQAVLTTPRNISGGKPSVVVVVKGINFDPDHPINPVQLVEWIEYTRLFKADHVVFYAYIQGPRRLSNDTLKVLRFYENSGFLELWTSDYIVASTNQSLSWTITLFLQSPSLNLLLDYNRQKFDYVSIFDIDEIWVPLLDDSFPSLMARLVAQHGHRPFTFTNWPFFTELPHTTNDSSVPISQRYLYRANMSHISWKTVSPISQCFVAHCHFCVRTYPNTPERIRVPEHIGALHHHTHCITHRPNEECQLALSAAYIVRDDSLLRYSTEITSAVNRTMQAMSRMKFNSTAGCF